VKVWAARLAAVFGAWLAIAVLVRVFGGDVHFAALAVYVVVGAALVWLYVDVSADAETSRWPHAREEPVRDPGEDPGLGRLRRVLAQHLDGREVGDNLHRRITELADQRLMARHGITRDADPEGAARLLGPELSSVAAARPPYRRLTVAHIDLLLTRIEEL
jgi:hypothetical protein